MKATNQKSDYLNWENAMSLIMSLERDKEFKMAALVGSGVFLGLRISDLVQLRYCDLLNQNQINITEKKTGKTRTIAINSMLKELIQRIYNKQTISTLEEHIFTNKNGGLLSTQYINRRLKEIKVKYRVKIGNFSCHSLRKAFGRRVYELNNCSERALMLLSEIFQHSSIALTRIYLGLRQEEISNVYLSL